MTANKKPAPFTIIRHRGTPNKGQLPNGKWVYGQSKIYVPEWGGFIPVAPYSDHFVYVVDDVTDKGSTFRCSCGSAAIIVGVSGYVHDASPQGKMIVCMVHSSTGKHVKGGDRWV